MSADRPRFRIFNAEPAGYSPEARSILAEEATVDDGPVCREQLLERAPNYDGIIVRLAHRLDSEFFARCGRRLRFVATATTGLDHIDLDAANRAGVSVLSLRNEQAFLQNVTATAELAFALMLALARRIIPASHSVTAGDWNRAPFRGNELRNKTLVIVGVGRLGRMVSRYAQAFGMRLIGVDPAVAHFPPGMTPLALADALALADIVSLHLKYGRDDPPVLDRRALNLLKPGCLIVNTARGGVIDEQALLDGLRSGRIGGAALDVLAREPLQEEGWPASDPLVQYARDHDNLILTPHIGGATYESMAATEIFLARKIVLFLRECSSDAARELWKKENGVTSC